MDINNLTIVGRLTKSPETGNNVARFSIAVNGYKDSVSFFNVVCFGKTGELVAKYLNKGSQVAINGEIKQNSFEDKQGNKRSSVDIIAQRVQFIGGKSGTDNQQNQNNDNINFNGTVPDQGEKPDLSDVPF